MEEISEDEELGEDDELLDENITDGMKMRGNRYLPKKYARLLVGGLLLTTLLLIFLLIWLGSQSFAEEPEQIRAVNHGKMRKLEERVGVFDEKSQCRALEYSEELTRMFRYTESIFHP